MNNLLAVKLSLPIKPDYDIEEGTLRLFLEKLDQLGCEETMVNSWSWGLFSVKASNSADLLPELQQITEQINAAAKHFGIYHSES